MKLVINVKLTATGKGSKSALAEAGENFADLESLIQEEILNWADQWEGESEDPKIEWDCTVEVDTK